MHYYLLFSQAFPFFSHNFSFCCASNNLVTLPIFYNALTFKNKYKNTQQENPQSFKIYNLKADSLKIC